MSPNTAIRIVFFFTVNYLHKHEIFNLYSVYSGLVMPKLDILKNSGRNCHTDLIVILFFLLFQCHTAGERVDQGMLDM